MSATILPFRTGKAPSSPIEGAPVDHEFNAAATSLLYRLQCTLEALELMEQPLLDGQSFNARSSDALREAICSAPWMALSPQVISKALTFGHAIDRIKNRAAAAEKLGTLRILCRGLKITGFAMRKTCRDGRECREIYLQKPYLWLGHVKASYGIKWQQWTDLVIALKIYRDLVVAVV